MFDFGSQYNKGQRVLPSEGNLGQVWISGYNFAHDIETLKKHNIFAVCSGVDLNFKYPSDFQHLKFDLNDCHTQDARYAFRPAYEFIEEARKKTNVLVHCAAGISRCSTLLIAYMMHKYGWDYDKSLQTIKKQRQICQPNTGFISQLKQLENNLKISPSKDKTSEKQFK